MVERILYNGNLYEVRHLGNISKNISREPALKDSDTITVYHGFSSYSISDAYEALTKGLSGKTRARRIYSYENNNNPNGLFVTPDINIAKRFATSGFIIEFNCKVNQLESPVWPNGMFTSQGSMAGYFNNEEEREAERMASRADYSQETLDFVKGADRPEVAGTLSLIHEKQSLFIGDLNPNMIRAVWYKSRQDNTFTRMSRKEALTKFDVNKLDLNVHGKHNYKMQKPNDNFNFKVVREKLREHGIEDNDHIRILETMLRTGDISQYFWPKQIEQIKKLLED